MEAILAETVRADLAEATVEWLEGHLSRFGGMARTIERSIPSARSWYLGHMLGVQLEDLSVDARWVSFVVTGSLSDTDLALLISAEVITGGVGLRFSEIMPFVDTDSDGIVRRTGMTITYTMQ